MNIIHECLTLTIFIFNFILFVLALCLIYIGIFSEYPLKVDDFQNDTDSQSRIKKFILYTSIFFLIFSFLGCYGLATNNKLFILIYSSLLLLLMFAQLFIGYVIYHNVPADGKELGNILVEQIQNATTEKTTSDDAFIHKFQRDNKCCGFDSFLEWQSTLGYIPGSCCNQPVKEPCYVLFAIKQPCKEILKKKIDNGLRILLIICIGIFTLTVILAFCTICILVNPSPSSEYNRHAVNIASVAEVHPVYKAGNNKLDS